MKLITVFVLALIAATAVLGASSAETLPTVLVTWSTESGVAVYTGAESARPVLLAFPLEVSVQAFEQSRKVAAAFGEQCRFVSRASGRAVAAAGDAEELLVAALEREVRRVGDAGAALALECRDATRAVRVIDASELSHDSEEAWAAGKPNFAVAVARVLASPSEFARGAAAARRMGAPSAEEIARGAPLKPYPLVAAEVIGDSIEACLGWAYAFVTTHFDGLPPFRTYASGAADQGVYALPVKARIALAADWGAGTMESQYVADRMMTDPVPDYTVHMGDIYYIGTEELVRSNCLGEAPPGVARGVTWPHGTLGSFAMGGNHEGYASYTGFYNTFLPTLGVRDPSTGALGGQTASYFAFANEYWRVVALDTGYTSYVKWGLNNKNNTQLPTVVDWMRDQLHLDDPSDTRGIIVLSHHQYFSAFDHPYTATPQQMAELVPAGVDIVWLWGHEHRAAWYNLTNADDLPLRAWGRCVGVGGFPTSLGPLPPRAAEAGLLVYDDRFYQLETGLFNQTVGFNGWTELQFDGAEVQIEYYSLALGPDGIVTNTTDSLLVVERFASNPVTGSVTLVDFQIVNSNLTTVVSGL